MKKTILILLVLVVALLAWFYSTKKAPQPPQTFESTNKIDRSLLSDVTSNLPTTQIKSLSTNELFNALTATNLEQWKKAIRGLHRLGGFKYDQHWVMEQTNHLIGIPIMFEQNGKTVSYKVQFIDVGTIRDSEKLMEVQMHSPSMNIDETRELGLQFCDLLQIDPKGFSEWCDKVGNHWLDAPLYSTETSAHLSFFILRTYNNEKPWSIDFQINNP